MKIMIIDDSGVMRRIHRNTLIEHHVDTGSFVEAADGARALELAKKEKVSLFLVDWNIPKLDGLEFIKTLRRLDVYKTTPMIMVTSEAARYNVMEAIAGGVTDYIIKPITGDILWEKVSPYLDGIEDFEEDLANEG
jgi:two-component system chemotaxis response regulator CheY